MKQSTPELTKLPRRTVLTITTVGDPNKIVESAMQAMYGSAYTTKFKVFKPRGKKMEIGAASAFWLDAHLKPRSQWTAIWNLEVSSFVKQSDIVQKIPSMPVKVKSLPAGTYAQILHVGPYSTEGPNIEKLHAFITTSGYAIDGEHEEVYLTKPGPKAKTIIRYAVKKKRT